VNLTLQRTTGLLHGGLRRSDRLRRRATNRGIALVGAAQQMSPGAKPELDDINLTRSVETEVIRSPGAPRGAEVNAVDGVVYLRGEVDRPGQIDQLEARARAIPGVREVENLLHMPRRSTRTRAGATS
jgi:osmotically-inducible protein OsmY